VSGPCPVISSAASGSAPSRIGSAGARPSSRRQVSNAAVVPSTIAAPRTQPAMTSLMKCTPSRTRHAPESRLISAATTQATTRHRPCRTGSTMSTIVAVPTTAVSAWPEGNEPPGACAIALGSVGRGR
jgi:hypothetical protein